MTTQPALDTPSDDLDFAALLEESLAESQLERGDFVTGTILAIDHNGLIVDVNWKHDGIVPRQDIERMGMSPSDFEINAPIDVVISRVDSGDGGLILSALQARQQEDWKKVEQLMESGEIWFGEVTDANRGGLIVPFGNLRGFIPASHVLDLPRGGSEDDRANQLMRMVGRKVAVKVIEVNRKRRRLVFSQRYAQRDERDARKQLLLGELKEGDVIEGVVSGLRDFGAFVDLGGADGLIHISELAWHRVKHPSEVVNIGDKVEVQILHLDEEGRRIGLSLKRLQPNPWTLVEELYHIGQLVEGVVSRVSDFGAFITLEPGIEALLHVSQISDDPNYNPKRHLNEGQTLLMRVISIEADKQRLGLSLREVTDAEQEGWGEKTDAVGENAEANGGDNAEDAV